MEFWVNQTFNGLSYAALLFLLGGGFTLIFGVMRIVNIAHGSFYLVGGYIGYTVVSLTGNFYLAFLVACIVVALLGAVMERVFSSGAWPTRTCGKCSLRWGSRFFFKTSAFSSGEVNPLNLPSRTTFREAFRLGEFYFPMLRFCHDRGRRLSVRCAVVVSGEDESRRHGESRRG